MDIETIYNSPEQIVKYVDNLSKLQEIKQVRHIRGYRFQERLHEVKLFNGLVWMDTCGNTMIRNDRGYYSPIRIPDNNSVCPVCGKGFSIYDLSDYIVRDKFINGELTLEFRHIKCNSLSVLNEALTEFSEIIEKVYGNNFYFKVIPNEYCNCELCAPWFIFTTSDGEIKIGWRKRVINIEWLDSYKPFSEQFQTEEVTKWFDKSGRGIHAWSVDKCIEYLQTAKMS